MMSKPGKILLDVTLVVLAAVSIAALFAGLILTIL